MLYERVYNILLKKRVNSDLNILQQMIYLTIYIAKKNMYWASKSENCCNYENTGYHNLGSSLLTSDPVSIGLDPAVLLYTVFFICKDCLRTLILIRLYSWHVELLIEFYVL